MLRLATHIEYLLFVNDCVIVPDFGGFVLQSHPAVYAGGTHTFYPPHKEIVFNPALKHHDGLLAESYMQLYEMNFREARHSLKNDIESLKTELKEKGYISLGRIGSFRQDREGRYFFRPNVDFSAFSANSYGLETFYFPPLLPEQETEQAETKKVKRKTGRRFRRPVSRMMWQATVVAAAVITALLLMSTPVKDVDRKVYEAGFTLSEVTPPPPATAGQPDVDSRLPEEHADGRADTPAPDLPETVTPPAKEFPRHQPSLPANRKTYYIIIGSFLSERQAEQYMSEIDASACRETGILTQNGKVRVYAARYGQREEAEAYLSRLRLHRRFKDAWLHVGR